MPQRRTSLGGTHLHLRQDQLFLSAHKVCVKEGESESESESERGGIIGSKTDTFNIQGIRCN